MRYLSIQIVGAESVQVGRVLREAAIFLQRRHAERIRAFAKFAAHFATDLHVSNRVGDWKRQAKLPSTTIRSGFLFWLKHGASHELASHAAAFPGQVVGERWVRFQSFDREIISPQLFFVGDQIVNRSMAHLANRDRLLHLFFCKTFLPPSLPVAMTRDQMMLIEGRIDFTQHAGLLCFHAFLLRQMTNSEVPAELDGLKFAPLNRSFMVSH